MTIEDKIDATAEQIEQSIEFGCLTKEHLRLILKQFTDEAVKKLNIDDVVVPKGTLCDVCGSENTIGAPNMGSNCLDCNPL